MTNEHIDRMLEKLTEELEIAMTGDCEWCVQVAQAKLNDIRKLNELKIGGESCYKIQGEVSQVK